MGRPAAFNRDDVLDRVTDLFWRKGYLASSVTDVVNATDLKPGSIYNAFNNKQGLLLEAIDRYGRDSVERAQLVQSQPSMVAGVEDFFQQLVEYSLADPDAKGCFLVNTWLEMSAHDEQVKARIDRVFNRVEAVFREGFEQARKKGELKQDCDPATLAKFVMMSIWGLRVLSRSRPGRQAMESVIAQVMTAIRHAAA